MNKAIFLDRDGTINKDSGYTFKIEDLVFLPNVISGLKELSKLNYKLIIITNQSGIGRGYYAEEDYDQFRDEMHKRLKNSRVDIDAEYFCPHHPTEGLGKYKIHCNCRKPKSGMLEKAAEDFNLDLGKCWFIGDRTNDIKCGNKTGCKTIQVLTGYEKIKIIEADYMVKDLLESAKIIINDE
jgi:D,D-heptose 1,7-bisphosphate phosphatase